MITGQRKDLQQEFELGRYPAHSCPQYKLAFERTCEGIDSGKEGEDGEWQ